MEFLSSELGDQDNTFQLNLASMQCYRNVVNSVEKNYFQFVASLPRVVELSVVVDATVVVGSVTMGV